MTPASKYETDQTDWGSEADTPPAPVSIDDVRQAASVIEPYLNPTPLTSHPLLNARIGASTFVKLENIQQIGAFKIRGAINLLASMDPQQPIPRGVVHSIENASTPYSTAHSIC